MKKATIIAAITILVLAVITLISGNSTPSTTSAEDFSTVRTDVNSGAKLYDVRTSQEYAAGHFEHAENWSLQDIQANKLPEIPKTTHIYVYCQSGNRSSQAARLLTDAGFENVTDLGGLQDVQKIGGKLQ
jgi:rhodanese-related sulfurtransferase